MPVRIMLPILYIGNCIMAGSLPARKRFRTASGSPRISRTDILFFGFTLICFSAKVMRRGYIECKVQNAKCKVMEAFLALLKKQTAIILFCLYDLLLVLNL